MDLAAVGGDRYLDPRPVTTLSIGRWVSRCCELSTESSAREPAQSRAGGRTRRSCLPKASATQPPRFKATRFLKRKSIRNLVCAHSSHSPCFEKGELSTYKNTLCVPGPDGRSRLRPRHREGGGRLRAPRLAHGLWPWPRFLVRGENHPPHSEGCRKHWKPRA